MHTQSKMGIRAAALLLAMTTGAAMAQSSLEEEQINASEVVFEKGQPYTFADGSYQPLKTRVKDGETIYYRMVRYDVQEGYLDAEGAPAAALTSAYTASVVPVTPYRYEASGLSRPDFYNSPYNRDARQRFFGPGYFGSCSRYDGCRGVEFVPLIPYRVRY